MSSSPDSLLLVACLCAQWCGSCRDYRATFDDVAREFPDARFVWIDIEDETELMGPVDVENFPTLLIASKATPFFFGPITPQRDTLVRLLRASKGGGQALDDVEVRALTNRLRGWH